VVISLEPDTTRTETTPRLIFTVVLAATGKRPVITTRLGEGGVATNGMHVGGAGFQGPQFRATPAAAIHRALDLDDDIASGLGREQAVDARHQPGRQHRQFFRGARRGSQHTDDRNGKQSPAHPALFFSDYSVKCGNNQISSAHHTGT
jgi:hypothetical protein